MRPKTLITGLLAAGLALTAAAAHLAPQDDEPTPLQEAMHEIMGGQRAMRRMVKDPAGNAEALIQASTSVQRGALAAFGLPPEAPEGQDADLWRIGYQRQMLQLLDAGLACEEAARKGDAEALAAAYSRLGEAKGNGHDKYKIDE